MEFVGGQGRQAVHADISGEHAALVEPPKLIPGDPTTIQSFPHHRRWEGRIEAGGAKENKDLQWFTITVLGAVLVEV